MVFLYLLLAMVRSYIRTNLFPKRFRADKLGNRDFFFLTQFPIPLRMILGLISPKKGPDAINQLVIRGLTKLKYRIRFVGPQTLTSLAESNLKNQIVYVNKWLQQTPPLHQSSTLRLLSNLNVIFGPNIEWNDLICKFVATSHRGKHVFLVHNLNDKKAYSERFFEHGNRWEIWTPGVDLRKWRPTLLKYNKRKQCVLFYIKSGLSARDQEIINELTLKLSHVKFRFIKYGEYTEHQYRKLLKQSSSVIWLGVPESFGIALSQCWAMDVPTLVRVPMKFISSGKKEQDFIPSMSQNVGAYFLENNTSDEIAKQLMEIRDLSPRLWMKTNFSLEHSTNLFLNFFED